MTDNPFQVEEHLEALNASARKILALYPEADMELAVILETTGALMALSNARTERALKAATNATEQCEIAIGQAKSTADAAASWRNAYPTLVLTVSEPAGGIQ